MTVKTPVPHRYIGLIHTNAQNTASLNFSLYLRSLMDIANSMDAMLVSAQEPVSSSPHQGQHGTKPARRWLTALPHSELISQGSWGGKGWGVERLFVNKQRVLLWVRMDITWTLRNEWMNSQEKLGPDWKMMTSTDHLGRRRERMLYKEPGSFHLKKPQRKWSEAGKDRR